MSFSKFLDRLMWLGMVVAATLVVGVAGIAALVIGSDPVRVGVTLSGALVVIIIVLWIRTGRARPPALPSPRDTVQLSPAEAKWLSQPSTASQSPQLLWQPPEPAAQDSIRETRPLRRIQFAEPPLDPEEDTKPTHPVKPSPVYSAPTPGYGPYDDLFPPPQPGDEDYLEYDPEATAKVSTHPEALAPDEQPTTPVGPVTPTIEQPGARSETRDQGDQPGESGEQAHSDPSDGEAPVPAENNPA